MFASRVVPALLLFVLAFTASAEDAANLETPEYRLQPGDLILAIDNAPVHSAQDALGQITTHKPGSRIAIHGLRGRREFDVHAQVTERPRNN